MSIQIFLICSNVFFQIGTPWHCNNLLFIIVIKRRCRQFQYFFFFRQLIHFYILHFLVKSIFQKQWILFPCLYIFQKSVKFIIKPIFSKQISRICNFKQFYLISSRYNFPHFLFPINHHFYRFKSWLFLFFPFYLLFYFIKKSKTRHTASKQH